MLKSGSSWNLVPPPTSNTKGGESGVMKALGLDQEEGQLIQLLSPASKLTNKLVSSQSKSLLVLGQATGNTDSLDSPRPRLEGSHHLPPYSILYVIPLASKWHFFPGLPEWSLETVPVQTLRNLCVHNFLLIPPIGMRSKENLQLSLRAFQQYVALHLHTSGFGQFLTFSGRESNCQFDSWPFICP